MSGELESRLHVIKQEILSRARLTDLINRFDLYPDLRARGDMDAALEQVRRDIQVELTGPEQVSGRDQDGRLQPDLHRQLARDASPRSPTRSRPSTWPRTTRCGPGSGRATTQFLEGTDGGRQGAARSERKAGRGAIPRRHVGELPQQVEVNLATLERLNTQLRLNGEQQMRALDQRDKLFDVPAPAPVIRRAPSVLSPETIRLEQAEGGPGAAGRLPRASTRTSSDSRMKSPRSRRTLKRASPAPQQHESDRTAPATRAARDRRAHDRKPGCRARLAEGRRSHAPSDHRDGRTASGRRALSAERVRPPVPRSRRPARSSTTRCSSGTKKPSSRRAWKRRTRENDSGFWKPPFHRRARTRQTARAC